MRNEFCPICRNKSAELLKLRFNKKLNLPISIEIRHCAVDNFLFVGNGNQRDYDEYYGGLANDTVHAEVSAGSARSAISKLQAGHLVKELRSFFGLPRSVFDFGCGEASLLVELALEFESSQFVGFDPGPASSIGHQKSIEFGLQNLAIKDFEAAFMDGPFDLVIASHVAEHLLDFGLIAKLGEAVAEDGLLYIEVPNALKYAENPRREFLYYFDRLHVNHFTPQALAALVARFGFAEVGKVEYAFPYRDGGQYPALGMFFKREQESRKDITASPDILDTAETYIRDEKQRAREIEKQFGEYDGVLVWGAGDNFFRSAENGGPLSALQEMVVLDRRPQTIEIGGRTYSTIDPLDGIRQYSWPVVITISEGRVTIADKVREIDAERPVFFV